MQRTVDMQSTNNMLVPEQETVIERTVNEQEESLKNENRELKVAHTWNISESGKREGATPWKFECYVFLPEGGRVGVIVSFYFLASPRNTW